MVSPNGQVSRGIAQKCAAGRDAVQIARLQEVVSKSRISSNAVPQHEFDCLGAYGDGASATPYRRTDGRKDFGDGALEKRESAREPGGRETEIARCRDLPQRLDGLGRPL